MKDSVVITDFGISTSIRVKDSPKKAGTPGWAPPEQFLGEKSNKEDHFALGRLLVYMFSSWQTAWPLLFYPKEQILKLNRYERLFKEIEETKNIKINRDAEIIEIIFQIHQAAVGSQFSQETIQLNREIYEQIKAIISGTVIFATSKNYQLNLKNIETISLNHKLCKRFSSDRSQRANGLGYSTREL